MPNRARRIAPAPQKPSPEQIKAARELELEKAATAHDAEMDAAAEKTAKGPKLGKLCALLPMMSEKELEGLTISIKEHGQCRPIVYTADGVLVDGKCRYEACRRLGIEPISITLEPGDDGEQLAWSEHFLRAHYNLSQRVMGLILGYVYEGKLPMRVADIAAENPEFSMAKIFQALFIIEHEGRDSVTVNQIMEGWLSLTEAYENVRARVDPIERDMKIFKAVDEVYPDLGEAVTEGHMPLMDAAMEFRRRFECLDAYAKKCGSRTRET
jgi:hypothetical protein